MLPLPFPPTGGGTTVGSPGAGPRRVPCSVWPPGQLAGTRITQDAARTSPPHGDGTMCHLVTFPTATDVDDVPMWYTIKVGTLWCANIGEHESVHQHRWGRDGALSKWWFRPGMGSLCFIITGLHTVGHYHWRTHCGTPSQVRMRCYTITGGHAVVY